MGQSVFVFINSIYCIFYKYIYVLSADVIECKMLPHEFQFKSVMFNQYSLILLAQINFDTGTF